MFCLKKTEVYSVNMVLFMYDLWGNTASSPELASFSASDHLKTKVIYTNIFWYLFKFNKISQISQMS